ncbi:tripartite tricarboxylate transporter substrate binding protein [Nocardiopsis coralliicola]
MTGFAKRTPLRRTGTAALAAGLALAATGCGGNLGGGDASEFPSGPVTLQVGQEAGGSTDLIARALAEPAAAELGVAMPVVNTPGANGALAAQEVAGQPPDGQNLILITASLTTITPLAVGADEAVDIDDYTVVTGVSRDDYVLVANSASGIDTLDGLLESDGIDFGTTGVGTGSQLAQELLFAQADTEGTAVPFDSGAPALTALLGEEVDVAALQLGEALGQIEGGELTPLLTFSEERNQYLPDVPTAAEEGYDAQVSQYRAVAAPKDTPPEVVEQLGAAFGTAFDSEDYQSFNEQHLLTPAETEGGAVAEEWAGLHDDYRSLAEEHGIDLGSGE